MKIIATKKEKKHLEELVDVLRDILSISGDGKDMEKLNDYTDDLSIAITNCKIIKE